MKITGKEAKSSWFPLLLTSLLFVSCTSQETRKHKELMDLFYQGFEYYYQEEYQKAHDCFDKCIQMDSTYVEFYENRGSFRLWNFLL